MMKRSLLFLFLLISVPCFAEVFQSNALGQNLGTIEALTGSGYEGESDNGTTVIYLDGAVVRKRSERADGYTLEYGDTVESVRFTEDGKRAEWRIENPDSEEVHTYFYDGDRLSSVSVSENGELVRRIVYLDTPSGMLAAITGSNDSYISPSFYLYELDGNSVRFTYHSNGVVTREDLSKPGMTYDVEDDGSWRESETRSDGTVAERLYSADGRLVEETEGDSSTSYKYDENGTVIESRMVNGSEEVISLYEDGRLVSSETLTDGVTDRVRNYLDSGEIEEIRYRDGIPEYSILFEGDGVRVREIHRL